MKFSLVKLICSKSPQKEPKHPEKLTLPSVRSQLKLETEVAASLLSMNPKACSPVKDTYFASPTTRYMGKPISITASSTQPRPSTGQVFCIGDSASSSISSSSGSNSQGLDEGYSSITLPSDPDIIRACNIAFFERSVY